MAIIIFLIIIALVGAFLLTLTNNPSSRPISSPSPSKRPNVTTSGVNLSVKIVKRIIRTRVEGLLVRYRESMTFPSKDFQAIMENQEEFKSIIMSRFRARISAYGVKATNTSVAFIPENDSVVLTCMISGSITKTGNKYYATFEWLIRPLGLDFIDDHFKETVKGLSWEGYVEGVSTIIDAEFPYTGQAYKAWGEPTGHCHAHVWWELKA